MTPPSKFYQVAQIIKYMWSCDQILEGYSSIVMREVIIRQIIYEFVQKTEFEGWSWFNVNNYGPEILQQCGKKIKTKGQKVLRKLEGGIFALSRSSHPEYR